MVLGWFYKYAGPTGFGTYLAGSLAPPNLGFICVNLWQKQTMNLPLAIGVGTRV